MRYRQGNHNLWHCCHTPYFLGFWKTLYMVVKLVASTKMDHHLCICLLGNVSYSPLTCIGICQNECTNKPETSEHPFIDCRARYQWVALHHQWLEGKNKKLIPLCSSIKISVSNTHCQPVYWCCCYKCKPNPPPKWSDNFPRISL